MAAIRKFDNSDDISNYVGTLSFLCAISCTIIMIKFRGFKATFNLSTNRKSKLRQFNDTPEVSLIGAYRSNKDELFGTINYPNPPKKITPSMVTLPGAQQPLRKDTSKSTGNLAQPQNENINITQSTPNIPQIAQEPFTTTHIKDQKKLEKQSVEDEKKLEKQRLDDKKKAEKQRVDEQKKQIKLAAREQKKQAQTQAREQEKAEKLRKEREKELQKTKAPEKKTKRQAPEPVPIPRTSKVQAAPDTPTPSGKEEFTDTLESSISRNSGPPPYTPRTDTVNSRTDSSGNTSFAIDDSSSWNMISQHRQDINRPLVVKSLPKQTHLDLNYNVGPTNEINSDA